MLSAKGGDLALAQEPPVVGPCRVGSWPMGRDQVAADRVPTGGGNAVDGLAHAGLIGLPEGATVAMGTHTLCGGVIS